MAATREFQNPIIPGFAPDPSVVRVDDTYFLVNSSFHLYPGLPIYASKDLQSWTHIGNGINRPDQLSLARASTDLVPLVTGHQMVGTSGLLAPTIRHYSGTFYIVCTNCWFDNGIQTKNFYIHTDDIWSGQWSNPVYFDFHGIDPSLYVDEDGRAYIQGAHYFGRMEQPTATIEQFQIDLETGKALSERRELWAGFSKVDTEGPHIYKKDGYYYLLVAEGGTFEHHMLSIARSKSVWGPFESYEKNPILTADGTKEYVQNTGHGELFQAQDGSWWAAVLAVRHRGDGRFTLGRETFLAPVSWPTGGWPVIEQPTVTFEHHGISQMWPIEKENFQQVKATCHVMIRDPNLSKYKFDIAQSKISIVPSTADMESQSSQISFLGVRQPELESAATATLNLTSECIGISVKAGLALYKDSVRCARLFFDFSTNTVNFRLINKHLALKKKTSHSIDTVPSTITFNICSSEVAYHFAFKTSTDDAWREIAKVDTLELTARDFTGPVYGLFATTDTGNQQSNWIDFCNFTVTQ